MWMGLHYQSFIKCNFIENWYYVVAALQRVRSEIGEATLAMLRSPEPASFEAFLIPLIDEIAQLQQDCILVLDDYHAIAGLYLQAQFFALRGRIDEAIALCQQGFELAKERGWLATYAGVLVQVALGELLREQNQLEAAAQHLTESIERGIQARPPRVTIQPGEFIRNMRVVCWLLLVKLRRTYLLSLQPLIEPLTARELEVLHYLAMGLPNRAIANQLYISLAGVKWHARHIYSKLNVNNRTQAVARARELGLLA
jgi:ATP/maltotriose-dependent transcriptional regulator MalT